MKLLSLFFLIIILIACSKTSEQEYFNKADTLLKEKKYTEAIKEFENLINEFPDSKTAPESIMRIASLYEQHLIKGISFKASFIKAAETYYTVYEKYPDSEEAPLSLFQSGFLYDNELKDYDKATRIYNLFLEKYPDHKYSQVVQQSLDIMGIDPNEIINKNQSANN
ncbi:MAG: tetratricopeptide repeat protein [Ignavibacterium sp.]|jgi:TolA-binding protein|nr:tetratricopeptide repeat protein [Ignavibacterium sp.]